jgi:CheY-like chemotaxis protein
VNDLGSSAAREDAEGPLAPLVLVADDYLDIRSMYGARLRRAGYRVAFASSGDAAVALARELRPSAIVMDLCLEGKDGWTATSELRADPQTRNVPIVVVSGHMLPEHQQRAYACGCDLFVPKPCLPDTLLSVVRGLLAERGAVATSSD